MEEKTVYTITLADGRVIENLTMNGSNFVSETAVEETMFRNNCSPMTVSDGTNTEIHEHAKLVQVAVYGGKYYLAFRDISEQELKDEKIRADIDYLAMMTDTDLEEG